MNCANCPHATAIPYPTKGGAIYICALGGCDYIKGVDD